MLVSTMRATRDTSQRRLQISELVRQHGSVQVTSLAKRFGVSMQTVRKDLRFLTERGVMARAYGGAIDSKVVGGPMAEAPYEAKRTSHLEEKRRIGQRAAAMVKPGDTIVIDSGTTGIALADALPNAEVTVVTNDFGVLSALAAKNHINIVMLGISWALFLGAMLTGVVVIGPLSDKVFHAGATGYGWLNGGWGVGAFLSTLYTSQLIAWIGARRSIAISMGALAICISVAPLSPMLAIAVVFFGIMGSARGVSGVAMNTSIMEMVPQHFMGRVQNTFYCAGTGLQIILGLIVGVVAEYNLVAGFAVIGIVYALAFVASSWPLKAPAPVTEPSPAD